MFSKNRLSIFCCCFLHHLLLHVCMFLAYSTYILIATDYCAVPCQLATTFVLLSLFQCFLTVVCSDYFLCMSVCVSVRCRLLQCTTVCFPFTLLTPAALWTAMLLPGRELPASLSTGRGTRRPLPMLRPPPASMVRLVSVCRHNVLLHCTKCTPSLDHLLFCLYGEVLPPLGFHTDVVTYSSAALVFAVIASYSS